MKNKYKTLCALAIAGMLSFTSLALGQEDQPEPESYESLQMAIVNLQTEMAELQALSEIPTENIEIVNVGEVLAQQQGPAAPEDETDDADEEMEEETEGKTVVTQIEENEELIAQLQQVLQDYTVITAALQQQDVALENVVAVNVTENGEVWVYYDERVTVGEQEAPESEPEDSETQSEDDGD